MRSAWWKPIALLAAIALAAFLAQRYLGDLWTREQLEATVAAAGLWAPAIFVATYVVATVLLLPGIILTLLAGVLFGPLWGILWAWTGGNLGAIAAYAVGRTGSGPIHDLLHAKLARIGKFLDAHSFGSVLVLRLIPIVPFNLLNYGLGFTGVATRAYVPATLIGTIPATAAYVLFGAALGNLGRFREPAFYLPLAIAILITLIAAWLGQRYRYKAAPVEG